MHPDTLLKCETVDERRWEGGEKERERYGQAPGTMVWWYHQREGRRRNFLVKGATYNV
jgi:hypothetical protein